MVEQLICNQQVVGSTPTRGFLGPWSSGYDASLTSKKSEVRILSGPLDLSWKESSTKESIKKVFKPVRTKETIKIKANGQRNKNIFRLGRHSAGNTGVLAWIHLRCRYACMGILHTWTACVHPRNLAFELKGLRIYSSFLFYFLHLFSYVSLYYRQDLYR